MVREIGDRSRIALVLNNLGSVAISQGDYAAARACQEESLTIRRQIGDRKGIAQSLGNLGVALTDIKAGDHVVIHATKKGDHFIAAEVRAGMMKNTADKMDNMKMDNK